MELPHCHRPGHEFYKVVRDGTYGKRRRQRFRCCSPDGTFHRFTPPLPRQRVELGVCSSCDNHIAVHEGPVVQRRGLYEVREIAGALADIAIGSSYTDAARRVRSRYWGPDGKKPRHPETVEGGQTVADWLHQFGPVISDNWAETEWPECVVADSTSFLYTDSRTKTTTRLFSVLAAWGYTSDTDKGRLWRIEARPTDTGADWAEFFSALPGRPRSVVCDRDLAIIAGAKHFGVGRNAVPVHLCEHHLWVRGMDALRADGHGGYNDELSSLFRSALQSLDGWEAFSTAVHASDDASATKRWVRHWDKRLRVQTARRGDLPAHYGNGAVEAPISELRNMLESRKWTFRNRERLNLLLDLMRLHLNGSADRDVWTTLMRDHLASSGGQAAGPRRNPDPARRLSNGTWQRQATLHR